MRIQGQYEIYFNLRAKKIFPETEPLKTIKLLLNRVNSQRRKYSMINSTNTTPFTTSNPDQGEFNLEGTLNSHILTASFGVGYCLGSEPTLADVCLIPQLYNAFRFNIDLSSYPAIRQIHQHCHQLEPFIQAVPENQPDAVE